MKQENDVIKIRENIKNHIRKCLSDFSDAEGKNIVELKLLIHCDDDTRINYNTALYSNAPGQFRNEVQKVIDDYSLGISSDWVLDIQYTRDIPPEAKKAKNVDCALLVVDRKKVNANSGKACISIVEGEAEQEEYELERVHKKINIGRGARVKLDDGFIRVNDIAFKVDSQDDGNKYVSRNHAHIEYDGNNNVFLLYADDGGVPPDNKIKIKSAHNNSINKLQSIMQPYKLDDGDQIILGATVTMIFSFIK